MNIEKIKEFLMQEHILVILLTIVIAVIILKIKDKIFNKAIKKIEANKKMHTKKEITYIKLTKNIINYLIIIVAILFILQLFGVNVSSIIAGLGVASVIAGLALQDALKDIIMGFNIIVDNYYSVGDVIKIGDFEGKVIELGVKTTKLQDVNNENVLIIANRNIGQALKSSDELIIDVPAPYEEKTEKIEKIIDVIVEKIKENENVKKVKYVGINQFADSAVNYRIIIWCSPEVRLPVKRYALRMVKLTLDENNITIPYTQIDIHQK